MKGTPDNHHTMNKRVVVVSETMSCLSFSPSIFIFCFYQSKEVSVSCLECESVVICSYGAEDKITKAVPQMAVALKSSSLISNVLDFVL